MSGNLDHLNVIVLGTYSIQVRRCYLGIFPKDVNVNCVYIEQLITSDVEDFPQPRHAGHRGGHQEAGPGYPQCVGDQAWRQAQGVAILRPVPGGGRGSGGAGGLHWQQVRQ